MENLANKTKTYLLQYILFYARVACILQNVSTSIAFSCGIQKYKICTTYTI